MAAASKMMSVTSCKASHTSSRKVLGFLGGMKFWPKVWHRRSRSAGSPLRPNQTDMKEEEKRKKQVEKIGSENLKHSDVGKFLGLKKQTNPEVFLHIVAKSLSDGLKSNA